MNLFRKLQAHSLAITIVIALVIALLCSAIIFLACYNRQWEAYYNYEQKLDRNLSSAINILMADSTDFERLQIDTLDIFGKEKDSVIIQKKYWGLFNVAAIKAFSNGRSKERRLYYGSSLPPLMEAAMYMPEHNRTLYVIGNTQLDGDVIISKAGIQASYLNQRGYNRTALVNGNIKESTDSMPALSSERISYLKELIASDHLNNDNLNGEFLADSISRSFGDSTLIVSDTGNMFIADKILKGNIILLCDSSIEIASSAKLENVLVIAPSVTIQSGFSGSLQVIASRSIVVENDCALHYPSGLVLLKDSLQRDQPAITVGADTKVEGVLFTYAPTGDAGKTSVSLEKGAVLSGIAYVCGYTYLKGTIYGTIATDYFLHKSDASLYENYLVDAVVNRRKMFPFYVGSPLFTGFKNNKLIQWID